MLWKLFPRSEVDQPSAARKDVVDEIIAWYVAQQQKWGAKHREHLQQELGFDHAAYLEAAWHFSQREDSDAEFAAFAHVYRRHPVAA
ncbi:MAG: hypothetical protein AAGJ40_23840 [Planctomycetota bacterium]